MAHFSVMIFRMLEFFHFLERRPNIPRRRILAFFGLFSRCSQ